MCHGGDGGNAVIKGFVIKDIIKKPRNDINILKHIIGICILPYRHMWLRVFCFPVFTVIQIRNGGQVFRCITGGVPAKNTRIPAAQHN